MLKLFFGFLCFFILVQYSSALSCCQIREIVFMEKCMEENYRYGIRGKFFACSHASVRSPILKFDGLLRLQNPKDKAQCVQELERSLCASKNASIILHKQAFCQLEVRSLEIKTYTQKNLYKLNSIARQAPNITELSWEMSKGCPLAFIAQFKHLKVLNLKASSSLDLNRCKDFNFNGTSQLTTLNIKIDNLADLKSSLKTFKFSSTFLHGMKNLQQFKLNCGNNGFEVNFLQEMFQGLSNLSELTLKYCGINKLLDEHFTDLTNLKFLNLGHLRFEDFDWIRSNTLAQNVAFININFVRTKRTHKHYFNNITYFKNYKDIHVFAIEPSFAISDTDIKLARTFCNEINCQMFVDKDGTKCPAGCNCTLKHYKMGLQIRCSELEAVKQFKKLPKPYEGIATLFLQSLNLTKLPNTTIDGYSRIRELFVADNQLDDLTISQLPENLTCLHIKNNRLTSLRPEVIDFFEQRIDSLKMYISGNPWTCGCYEHDFLKFVEHYQKMIVDFEDIKCDGIAPAEKQEKCRLRLIYLIVALSISFIAVFIIVFWFRTTILLWLYDHNIFVSCILRTAENIDFPRKFDAFLAYSHQNLDLVPEYVEQLEKGKREFKLCFYQRDWAIGESIPACILESIDESKRIIVLMTMEFVRSSWGAFEFRTAIRATSMHRTKRLIIIVYPDVENFNELDTELRLYMKYNTYLRRDDPQFWRKLIYAMPHKKISKPKKKATTNGDNEAQI